MVGSDMERAANLAQNTYQGALHRHGHHGRAFIETLVKLCREHPNIVGIGVGLLVEQLLAEEKREFDRRQAVAPVVGAEAANAAGDGAAPAHADSPETIPALAQAPAPGPETPVHQHEARLRLHAIHPGRLALEVFGALLLLKFGVAAAHMFGRKRPHHDGWFASAAKIHLLSASIATYYFAKSLRARRVSAWRNAAVALFGTDAVKPLLKPQKSFRTAA
jgi:hypothetical protein